MGAQCSTRTMPVTPCQILLLLLSLFYRGANRGWESACDLPQATWILYGRARLEADGGLSSAEYSWVQEGQPYGGRQEKGDHIIRKLMLHRQTIGQDS